MVGAKSWCVVTVAVLGLGLTGALLLSGNRASGKGPVTGTCLRCVDGDGNGICDRKEQGLCGRENGKCRGAEGCPRFVDEDGNGICDRKEAGGCCKGEGGCGKAQAACGAGQGGSGCKAMAGGCGGCGRAATAPAPVQ